MKNLSVLTIIFLLSQSFFGQNQDDELIKLVAKACQTDSIVKALEQHKEDSSSVFYFKTPDAMEFGIGEYDFQSFFLNFDTGSNLLFKGTPYGSLEDVSLDKKKASFTIHISGDGDRKKKNKFESSTFTFINKKGRWFLDDIIYN